MELVNMTDDEFVTVISNSEIEEEDMETLLDNDPEFQARLIEQENQLREVLIETEYAG